MKNCYFVGLRVWIVVLFFCSDYLAIWRYFNMDWRDYSFN
ncbi:Unknown protein sequence [Pseudomonas syringae pv. maculicola]|nr:Unknown protein sequence [Pseudomonas syringae pv. maculicola]